jgi:hypothetical protein
MDKHSLEQSTLDDELACDGRSRTKLDDGPTLSGAKNSAYDMMIS